MTEKEAKALKAGDKVTTKNGVYTQHGQVVSIESDGRGGIWIHYEWVTLKKRNYGMKRPCSVHLGWLIFDGRQWIPL